METGLRGRVALVTGAGGGIGLASVRGWPQRVVASLPPTCDPIRSRRSQARIPDQVVAVIDDIISSTAGGPELIDAATGRFGRLDVLVTCAGVYETGTAAAVDHDAWDRVLTVNLRGTYLCCRAAVDAMAVNRWGRIVTLGPMAADTGASAPVRRMLRRRPVCSN